MMPDNIFDNRSSILKDDLVKRLRGGDRTGIAAYFSIYGFEELCEQLEACKEFRSRG